MGKLVPCSPQRFVAPSTASAPRAADLLTGSGDEFGLAFTVLGSAGEQVAVTVAAPPYLRGAGAQAAAGAAAPAGVASPLDGTILVTEVVLGPRGSARVVCTVATGCAVVVLRSGDVW